MAVIKRVKKQENSKNKFLKLAILKIQYLRINRIFSRAIFMLPFSF